MEEELNYVMVTFKPKEKPNDLKAIYEEVKTEGHARDTKPIKQENEKRALLCTPLYLLAACLGIICVILASAVIALTVQLKTVMAEQSRQSTNLTAQNLLLWKEKTDLETQTKELTKERDRLNWTIGVILDYETFTVNTHCPQKVCKPCLDKWVPFQSNCYLFYEYTYWSYWMTWQESRDYCRARNADLVVIDSQEEQEFISNHTTWYNDDKHGYWIGMKKEKDTLIWVDGSNLTVMYWTPQQNNYRESCVLSLPRVDPLANWQKESCSMRNCLICETRALIKPD